MTVARGRGRGRAAGGTFHSLVSAATYFGANIGAKLIGFAYFLLLARWLEVDGFGLVTFAAGLAVMTDTATDLGMARFLLRETARDPASAPGVAGRLLPAKIAVSLGVYAAVVLLLPPQYHTEVAIGVLAVYAIWIAASGAGLLLEQVLHARGAFGIASAARVLPGLAQFGAAAVAWKLGAGAPAFAAAAAFGAIVYLATVTVAIARHGLLPRFALGARLWMSAVAASLPFAFVGTLLLLSLRFEFLLLGLLADPGTVAVYGMAARFYEAGLIAPIAVATVLTPRIIESFERDAEAAQALLLSSLRTISSAAVAAAFLGLPLVGPVMSGLLPPDYAASAGYLAVMLAGYAFHAVHILNASAMLALPRQRRPALVMLGLAAGQIVLAYVLIALHGAPGAAGAVVLSAALAALVSSLGVRAWLLEGRPMLRALVPAMAGGILGATGLMLPWPLGYLAALALALGAVAAATHLVPLGSARVQ